MKKATSIVFVLFCISMTWSQVGINTTTPNAALDVVGDAIIDNSLYLEDPGDFTTIRGSKLLIRSTANSVLEYDITQSKYGPINYAEFAFTTVSKDGLLDYDTKISTTDYIVTIQGYYFLEAGTGDTNVMTHSTVNDLYIEGYQIYAYENPVTQTWFLRAFINNGEFIARNDDHDFEALPIDLFLNVVIFRRGFISKSLTPVAVNMGNSETGTAPLPTGF